MTAELTILRALADPTRLRIVALLEAMELSVGELAQVLEQSQPRVSRHVKILVDACIAERRKEGSWVFLRLGETKIVGPLLAALDAWMSPESVEQVQADSARLAAVRADRAAAAQSYFAAHAGQWDAIRSLHVAESEVESAIAEAIGERPLNHLVDIGTGTGRMLELFSSHAKAAVGVDRSPEMLRLARVKLGEAGLGHAELRQGDMYALDMADDASDLAILHQVLHFAQDPAAVIAEVARILVPGGRVLIADFAAHEREELRIRDAHARLGFSEEQIERWFAAADLKGGMVDELRGGELTVKLWLGRKDGQPVLKDVAA